MSARTLALRGLCGLAVLGLGACAGGGANPKTTSYVVTAGDCEFFKYGPAQAFGPDLTLKRGDRVTLVQKQFGYSRIVTGNGTAGYVATEDIAPAPAPAPTRPIAALTRGRIGGGHSGVPRQSDVRPTAGDPLFDVNDVPSPPLPKTDNH